MGDANFFVVARYRPSPELGEFANVGVVLFNPSAGNISFKLAPKRFRRVTQFFDHMDAKAYSEAMSILSNELHHISAVSEMRNTETSKQLFISHFGKSEGSITFSGIRSISARRDDDALERLYDRYVRRNLESLDQREILMARQIRDTLAQRGILDFRARQIEDELMPVRLPLVSKRTGAVIKPMAFDQKSTLAIIDHANIWRDRFNYLLEKGKLHREAILIPVEPLDIESDRSMIEAYHLARLRMGEIGVEVVDYIELDPWEVTSFAERTSGRFRSLLG